MTRIPPPHRFEVTAWTRGIEEPCFVRVVPNIDEAHLVGRVLAKNPNVSVWEVASFTSGMISWCERVPRNCIRDFGKRFRLTSNRADPLLDLLWCDDWHGWFVGRPGAECPWCFLIATRRELDELEAAAARRGRGRRGE